MIGQAALSWSSAWTAHAGCSGGCCCLTDCIGEPAFPPSGPSPLIVVALGRERGCGCMAQWVGAMPRIGTSL